MLVNQHKVWGSCSYLSASDHSHWCLPAMRLAQSSRPQDAAVPPGWHFLSLHLSQPLSSVATCWVRTGALAVCPLVGPITDGSEQSVCLLRPRASGVPSSCLLLRGPPLSPRLPHLPLWQWLPFSGLSSAPSPGPPFRTFPDTAGPSHPCDFKSCVGGFCLFYSCTNDNKVKRVQ